MKKTIYALAIINLVLLGISIAINKGVLIVASTNLITLLNAYRARKF